MEVRGCQYGPSKRRVGFVRRYSMTAWPGRGHRAAFTLAELLVVIGVIALLLALTVPTLQLARRQAQQTHCASNLQQQGVALENVRANYDGFYPLWDDGGRPTRYTWIDVLVQLQVFGTHRAGYCPADRRPDRINEARAAMHGLYYPGGGRDPGVDYSYGIGVPLSAAGWKWQPSHSPPFEAGKRKFWNHEDHPTQRVLAADATWTYVYNLSGDYLRNGIWNLPTQFDNTVAWLRHPNFRANALLQDGHVESLKYQMAEKEEPGVDTQRYFVWYPGESINVGPDYPDPYHENNYYPDTPPIDWSEDQFGNVFPSDLIPYYYTVHDSWTQIRHK